MATAIFLGLSSIAYSIRPVDPLPSAWFTIVFMAFFYDVAHLTIALAKKG